MNEYLQHPLTTAREKAWSSGGGSHLLDWNTVAQLDAVVNTDKPSRDLSSTVRFGTALLW